MQFFHVLYVAPCFCKLDMQTAKQMIPLASPIDTRFNYLKITVVPVFAPPPKDPSSRDQFASEEISPRHLNRSV